MSSNPYAASQSEPHTAAGDVQSPTRVRLLVVGICIAMSMLLYLDRFAITPATNTILAELKLSKGEFGETVRAFFLAYALMQIPAGWLTDVLGARWMLALFVLGWSLAIAGLGLADGVSAIWGMRLILGVMQAGAYPAAAGLLKRWVPFSARGLANSVVAMGGRCGLLISMSLTVPFMLLVGRLLGWETDQWRAVFMMYGLLGIAWAAGFVWIFRDWPREHPWVNDAEVQVIEGSLGAKPARPADDKGSNGAATWCCGALFVLAVAWVVVVGRAAGLCNVRFGPDLKSLTGSEAFGSAIVSAIAGLVGMCGILLLVLAVNRVMRRLDPVAGDRLSLPLGPMLRSKEVLLMCGINFCVNIGWIFLATWLPQYLVDVHGVYVTKYLGNKDLIAGWMTAVTGIAAMCGGMLGGRATDVFVRRFGRVWGRRLPGMCAGMLVAAMYLVVPQLPGLWLFIGAMIAIAFTIDFGLGATWASYQDIGGRHVASVLGCGNMCGNLGAAFFGGLIGYLADEDRWNTVFFISAAAMLLASCGWMLFDASRPVVADES
jgi:MFS family permease